MVYLKNYLDQERMLFLTCSDKKEALEILTEHLANAPFISDFPRFKKAVFDREAILSTGIGFGVAIPHVKIKEITEFFICVGIHATGLDWESIDNKPVQLVFLIGGPDDHQTYLRILAKLTLILKNPATRDKLLECKNPQQITKLFESF